MRKPEIAALALKILGVYTIVQALPMIQWVIFYGFNLTNGKVMRWVIVLLELLPISLMIVVGVILIKKGDAFALKLYPDLNESLEGQTQVSPSAIQTIAFSVVGLFILLTAIPKLVGVAINLYFAYQDTDSGASRHMFQRTWVTLASTVVQAIVGLSVFLQARAYQHKREPLTTEETDKLANTAESFREKLLVYTLLDTGLRVSEFVGLKKENIQWQEKRLTIYGKGGMYGKKSKRRIVPMTPRVHAVLEKQFAYENEINMVRRTVQRVIKRVAERAGITKPVSPHVLRHTFSVNCIKRGISTRSLQNLLGHDRLSTTEIYMNLSPEDTIREFETKW